MLQKFQESQIHTIQPKEQKQVQQEIYMEYMIYQEDHVNL